MQNTLSVYILGVGSMGSLIAHEVANKYSNQIRPILLFRSRSRNDSFLNARSELQLIRTIDGHQTRTISVLDSGFKFPVSSNNHPKWIENLVVATKNFHTETALKPYLNCLDEKSNVIFVQNGMGSVENCITKLWPNERLCPKIYQTISTHGAFKSSPNTIHHVGIGSLTISRTPYPGSQISQSESEIPEFLKLLTETPNLNASYVSYEKFLVAQIEKFVSNCCINALTTILDCQNGDLLLGNKTGAIMRSIISEALKVMRAEYQSISQIPEANTIFDEDRMLANVIELCQNTSKNSSSMREDVRHLNQTEIQSLNGYILQLGIKRKISTPTNRILTNLIKSKLSIERNLEIKATNRIIDES